MKKVLTRISVMYLIPVLVAGLVFIFSRVVFTGWVLGEAGIGLLIAGWPAETAVLVDKRNFSHVTYRLAGLNHQVTETKYTTADLSVRDDWLTWMEQQGNHWQILVHHIPTGQTMQLTRVGNNVNPKMSEETIAWERFDGLSWQLFAWNGVSIRQITQAPRSSTLAGVSGQSIVYTQRLGDGAGLTIFTHNIPDESTTPLAPASADGKIKIVDNEIIWTARIAGQLEEQRYQLP
jgi:hypothetical protein